MSMSEHAAPQRIDMPLTDFIVALYKMTMEQRKAESAEKAAERYGLPLDLCQWWIEESKRTDDRWPIRGGARRANGKHERQVRRRNAQ